MTKKHIKVLKYGGKIVIPSIKYSCVHIENLFQFSVLHEKTLNAHSHFQFNTKIKEKKVLYIILVYDIEGDEKGQWVSSKVFKTCKRYLTHIQKSVFEGSLSSAQCFSLENDLKEYIRPERDSVIVFKHRDDKWVERETWGMQDNSMTNLF